MLEYRRKMTPFAKGRDFGMQKRAGFDWLALAVALVMSAFFALTARFNSIPAASFVPAAVLSATGGGLLVTAVHKLRGRNNVGLWEAGLAGLLLALCQFLIGLTYPALFSVLHATPRYIPLFLLTWGLIGLFAILLSLLGASLGHLAFAPLRPLPVQTRSRENVKEVEDEAEEEMENEDALEGDAVAFAIAPKGERIEIKADIQDEDTEGAKDHGREEVEVLTQEAGEIKTNANEAVEVEKAEADAVEETQENAEQEERAPERPVATQRHALANYAIGVLLLSLLPMMAGYIFAAAYDFVLNANNVEQIYPAFYPTLGLLSGLLPWQIVLQSNLGNEAFSVFTHLWRIPNALGNPAIFDVQALEPLLFNAAALALLLLTMYKRESHETTHKAAPWGVFLGLEMLLGLMVVLAPNLWLMRGLEGILQFSTLAIQLPTVSLLNPMLFTLNLATGMVFCVLVGLVIRRQYQLWTLPRKQVEEEE